MIDTRLLLNTMRCIALSSRSIAALSALMLFTLSGCHSQDSSPSVQSLQITPARVSIAAGTSAQLAATAIYSNSTHSDVTSTTT
jgi:hypothetical protein